ncbi:cis-Golgi t-SNARE syntaxin [Aspergillus nanangensis]|uniref:Cis-Golgi t-SNARE syntaxin n=1 Tax=Aspergillus nanangensis TaxID=2582783 RepID=A0AAD4CU77_ASPNN|nr:cis-Golgi t-SNARE syntaxin [Aspergillus nanangensis]
MTGPSIQDRTVEFRSILGQAQKRLASSKVGTQRQALLSDSQRREANGVEGPKRRSEFARRAADIGRAITGTTAKLQRLAELAKRKTLFDDRPVEISELTYVIKQDLASLNQQIASLQQLTLSQHPKSSRSKADQEGEHNDNVVVMLQGKLADVGANFKEVLEVRTKNIQASRSRTENFVSSVSSKSQTALDTQRSDSPLYNPSGRRTPQPGGSSDLLTLEPSNPSPLGRPSIHSDQQLLVMEEAQNNNSYIQARGEAIDAIERTISELGGIFGQLAQMVSEQSEMIQRIDANTEDVVDNVQGAQRELMKYWTRVSGNRWLIAQMFGVLMSSGVWVSQKGKYSWNKVCPVLDNKEQAQDGGIWRFVCKRGPYGDEVRRTTSNFNECLRACADESACKGISYYPGELACILMKTIKGMGTTISKDLVGATLLERVWVNK